ncbi:MAG: hypothetical protein U1E52_11940 [Geminicoccaceae bacterium]
MRIVWIAPSRYFFVRDKASGPLFLLSPFHQLHIDLDLSSNLSFSPKRPLPQKGNTFSRYSGGNFNNCQGTMMAGMPGMAGTRSNYPARGITSPSARRAWIALGPDQPGKAGR